MVFHEPIRGERRARAGASSRGFVTVLLVTAVVACGRSELDEGDVSDDGGFGGKAGGTSTSGRGGGNSGGSGLAGGPGSSGASGGPGGSAGSEHAGSSGASGNAGNGGASGSAGSFENCTNGIDDDRDGNVDCADSDCVVGFSCAPPTPGGGWVGPVSFWSGSGTPPACTNESGFPTEAANAGILLSVAPPTCYSCECGAPQGVACQAGAITAFADSACSSLGRTLNVVQGACIAFVSLSFDPASVRWESAQPAGGACIPRSSGSAVFPPPQWNTRMRACGDPPQNSGGCGTGTCVARQKAPFSEQFCIYQRGDLACPAGPYSNRSRYFAGVEDTRACSACECGLPSATSCSGTMRLYTDQSCGVDETVLTSVSQCSLLTPDPTPPPLPYLTLRSVNYSATADAVGFCEARPSTPSGSVVPNDPITVCCTP